MTGDGASAPHLTPRQVEVIQLLARGDTNRQIAVALRVSERAIKAHVSILLEKFGVQNRAGLIARVLSADPRATDVAPDIEYGLYEDAPFMVQILHGPEHRVAYLNRKFEEIVGLSAASMLGRSLREVFPNIKAEFLDSLDHAYRTGQPRTFENLPGRWHADDGTERQSLFSLIVQPIRSARGSIIGLLAIGAATPT